MTISCRQICRAHGSGCAAAVAPARPTAGMITAPWEQSTSWDYVKNVSDASPCKQVLTFVERTPAWSDLSDEQLGLGQADGGVTAKKMWKDEENDRKLWWRRGGGKMGSISSAWLSASKRSRVSDCSKWQIKGPFMLLHKCSLRTGCKTDGQGVRVRLCSCRGRRLGYRQLCVWWL